MKPFWVFATSAALVATATAQVGQVNGIAKYERFFNDDPTSVLTTFYNYPTLVTFDDESVDNNGQQGGFANKHKFEFSADNGTSSFPFSNDTFFEVFSNFKLESSVNGTRKETGFTLSTIGGEGQFIVNDDAHEVVVFGGPMPFYRFPFNYVNGSVIRMGFRYYRDPNDNLRKVIYFANGQMSPPQTFTDLEQGIIDGSTLGEYLQVAINRNDPNNFGRANFSNITITPLPTNPTFLSVFRGVRESGDVTSLADPDLNYLVVRNGVTALRTESPITIVVEATSPISNPTTLEFGAQGHVSITGLTQRIDLFNWISSQYDQFDSRPAPTDDAATVVRAANPSLYTGNKGHTVRSRFRVRADGPVFTNTWRAFIDRLAWFIE